MKKVIACALIAFTFALQALPAHAAATLLPNGEQCFQATSPTSGGLSGPLTTLGTISAGSGYVNGTYTNVPLTGGSGFGATATIIISGNAVANVSLTNLGTHYAVGDTLSAASANLGGSGSGFSVPVVAVSTTGTGMLGLMGPITAGTGGVTGTYANVTLTGGSGTGAMANVTVSGGGVTSVTILNPGIQYVVGDILSAASGSIGGTTGFAISVSSVTINQALAGGSVAMFIPNTNTFKQTWKNSTQTILNTNPITLDQNGCATIYGVGSYRQVLQDALGDVVWDKLTTDTSAQQNVFWAGIAGGTPNNITLVDPGFNATDGSIINFTALFSNTGATTINPSGFGLIPVEKDTSAGPQGLGGGEIVATNPISVIYRAQDNAFHILNSIITLNTDQCLLITAFGGSGNNITDNTAPLIAAFNAMTGNGGCIYFQPGKYRFNSHAVLNLPAGIFSLTLRGGGQDNTILTWPSAVGGISVNYGGLNSSVHISDLSLTTGVIGGGGAVQLNQTASNPNPAVTAFSDFTRVTIRGDDGYALSAYWNIGIDVENVSNIGFFDISITGPSGRLGTGINLVGLPSASTFAVGYDVTSVNIGNLQYGILYGSFIQGLQVSASNFIGNQYGIITLAGETGTLTSALITNTNFDNFNADILFQTQVGGATFTGNDFFINFAQVNGFSGICVSCSFTGNLFLGTNTTNTCGICLTSGASNNIIVGNIVQGVATGIGLSTGTSKVNVQSNSYNSNTTDTIDNGTSNTIGGGSP